MATKAKEPEEKIIGKGWQLVSNDDVVVSRKVLHDLIHEMYWTDEFDRACQAGQKVLDQPR